MASVHIILDNDEAERIGALKNLCATEAIGLAAGAHQWQQGAKDGADVFDIYEHCRADGRDLRAALEGLPISEMLAPDETRANANAPCRRAHRRGSDMRQVSSVNLRASLRREFHPMALIQCRECKKEVSDKAAACPNCGAPPKPLPKKSNGKDTLIVIGGLVFIALLVGSAGKGKDESGQNQTTPQSEGVELNIGAGEANKFATNAPQDTQKAFETVKEEIANHGGLEDLLEGVELDGSLLYYRVKTPAWKSFGKSERENLTSGFHEAWAGANAPVDPKKCYVAVIDENRNVIAGSREGDGSQIWAD